MEHSPGISRVALALFAAMLILPRGTGITPRCEAQQIFQQSSHLRRVFLSWGESITLSPGVEAEPWNDGSVQLIGPGGSFLTWTFQAGDPPWVIGTDYQTIKNASQTSLTFSLWAEHW